MIAFTFPGQGSQKPGMGEPWREHPSWELVSEASAASGRDVEHLLLHAGAEDLVQTRNSQLATFVLSMVVLDAVERLGVEPALVAGHSLGEYSALVASGALAFEDGAALVAARSDAMHDAASDRPGTMAAVLGLDDDLVEVACARIAGDVWVANYNGPGQVVIAGATAAVAAASDAARELGAKRVMPVAVSGAFHTPYVEAARDPLRKAITNAGLRDATLPVLANVDALPHQRAVEWIELLVAQLCSPVRWRQVLHHMGEHGIATIVELGAGNVLSGIAKRTLPGVTTANVAEPDHLDRLLEVLAGTGASSVAALDGEHLFATERLVVSPSTGIFRPAAQATSGGRVEVGDLLGHVGEAEVRSAFAGQLMGTLAETGERVTGQQPIAWLRSA